jgi:prolyl-tRNA synthetase
VPARLSELFVRTRRDDPGDAEVRSHALLVRAGYVRRVAAGIWTWMPLGLRVLDRVEAIVREEMDAIGAQQVQFPALLPKEPYETTGRWAEYGDGIFRLQDRRGLDYLLGPTHEELFTLLVKGECSSYKDLPLILYQVQTKYRDEVRPRAGILRGREFLMKDSYSFDLDDDGLAASYLRHRDAYTRIFDRLGLDYRVVAAAAGAMGGSASEEFLAVADAGEDTFVSCSSCTYAANVEAAEVPAPPPPAGEAPPTEVLDTPGTPTIATLVDLLRARGHEIGPGDTLKNVVVKLQHPAGRTEVVGIGLPGDREVDAVRLQAQVEPATVEPFTDDDFADHPRLVRGYIGPAIFRRLGLRYLVDPTVVPGTSWVTGADESGRHAIGVTCGRDFEPDGTIAAAEVRGGDPCPRCDGELSVGRGIEIGHVFQLGRKYADAFELDVLGADGIPQRVTMGSYGIGVSRAVAAIVEQHADDLGLRWPRSVAPFDVHVCAVGNEGQLDAATALSAELEQRGLRVVLDDRGASAGVQFTDAELLGVPTIVVVGRGLANGEIEVRDRWSVTRRTVRVGEVADVVAV